jgi:choline-phosphate cytidylyltransferase
MTSSNDTYNNIDLYSRNIPDGKDPKNPVRIYTDGIFDCFHFGHARLLMKIKKMFDYVYLIVGVCGDEMTWKEKGRSIMYDYERYESVRHCKWVDEVYEDAPWVPTVEFLDKIKCHYLAHDPEPYPMGDNPDVYSGIKKVDRFLSTTRTEGISTTDIMMRIIRNYEDYVERNIKKGMNPEDLNVKLPMWFALKLKIFVEKVERKRNERKKNGITKYYFEKYLANIK